MSSQYRRVLCTLQLEDKSIGTSPGTVPVPRPALPTSLPIPAAPHPVLHHSPPNLPSLQPLTPAPSSNHFPPHCQPCSPSPPGLPPPLATLPTLQPLTLSSHCSPALWRDCNPTLLVSHLYPPHCLPCSPSPQPTDPGRPCLPHWAHPCSPSPCPSPLPAQPPIPAAPHPLASHHCPPNLQSLQPLTPVLPLLPTLHPL